MKTPRNPLLTGLLVLISLSLMLANGRAAERIETTNRAGIKLSYIPAAKLNAIELRQVLSLARQVGITNVGEVSTGYSLPTATRHVFVKSRERVNGRNIRHELVTIEKSGWGREDMPKQALRSGSFWVEPSSSYTVLERTYEIGGTRRRITVQEKDIPVADIAIPLIAAKKVRINDSFGSSRFETISLLQPARLRKSNHTEGYELWLNGSQEIIHFRIENGEVVITTVGTYSI